MLDKGIIERIVLDYKDVYKQAVEDNLASPVELPYFDGDFWPNALEDCIRELEEKDSNPTKCNLTTKTYCILWKHKEAFLTVRLHSDQSEASLGPIGKFY